MQLAVRSRDLQGNLERHGATAQNVDEALKSVSLAPKLRDLVRELVRKGIEKTDAELADAEAVEHALGIDRHVLSLALHCEQLIDSRPGLREENRFYRRYGHSRNWTFKRRKDGSLYRGKLAVQLDAAAALAKRGGEWERLAALARQHGLALPNRNADWLAPYQRMVELERERLTSAEGE